MISCYRIWAYLLDQRVCVFILHKGLHAVLEKRDVLEGVQELRDVVLVNKESSKQHKGNNHNRSQGDRNLFVRDRRANKQPETSSRYIQGNSNEDKDKEALGVQHVQIERKVADERHENGQDKEHRQL